MSWKGLYAVTDTSLATGPGLVESVAAALEGGAVMVQYRDKTSTRHARLLDARALLGLCRDAGAPLIINDDVELAREVGADGVHVGRDDEAIAKARETLGPEAIVGASCYHDLERALEAQAEGASYVAFGRFFTSQTKPGAALATPDLLRRAHARLSLPIAAIGGITAQNALPLVDAGADLLAVVNDLWSAADVRSRAAEYGRCFHPDSAG